jgi:hypothetical protein
MVDTAQRRISGSLAAACFGVAVLAGFGAVTLTPVSPAAAAPAAIPDFAPNPNVGWVAFAPQFIPPPTGPGPVGDDPAHKRVSNDDYRARGAQPTFPIGDLNSPILQPWAKEQMRKYNERVLRGEPAYSRTASCWPYGVPGFLLYPVQPVYFLQTPKEVIMIWQADHQIRHVYLNVPHATRVKPSWFGESVGHYEGDTLVVDTVGIDARTFVDNYQTPHTEKLHVTERFRMTDGGKILEVNLHVEDPGTFTTAWNAIQRYNRVEPRIAENVDPFNLVSSTSAAGPILEASCAENPISLFGEASFPVPQATPPDF